MKNSEYKYVFHSDLFTVILCVYLTSRHALRVGFFAIYMTSFRLSDTNKVHVPILIEKVSKGLNDIFSKLTFSLRQALALGIFLYVY